MQPLRQRRRGNSGGSNASSGEDLSKLSGQIRIDGSSTVYPFTTAVAENFRRKYPAAAAPIRRARRALRLSFT